MSEEEENSYDSDVEMIEVDEIRQLCEKSQELNTLGDDLVLETETLAAGLKDLKETINKFQPLPRGWFGASSQDLLQEFRTKHEELKNLSEANGKPAELVNSWRGIVAEEPKVVWTIDPFLYSADYKDVIRISNGWFTSDYYVWVDRTLLAGRVVPTVTVELEFPPHMKNSIVPAIIVVVKGKNEAGEEKIYTERQNSAFNRYGARFLYGRTSEVELIQHDCVSLVVEIYMELAWSALYSQSYDGTLSWTVDNFARLFEKQDFVLYSPYFRTRRNENRWQVSLFWSEQNLLTLMVIKQYDDYVELSEYMITVTIVRENLNPVMLGFRFVSEFTWTKTYALGRIEDIVGNDTFFCKVEILST